MDSVVEYPRVETAAGLLWVHTPTPIQRSDGNRGLVARDPLPVPVSYLHRSADFALVDELARFGVGRDEYVGLADCQLHTGSGSGIRGLKAFADSPAKRFFAVDVFAGFSGHARHWRVEMRWGRDVDSVDARLTEHLLVGRVGFRDPLSSGEALDSRAVTVAYGDHFRPWMALVAFHVGGGHQSQAHHPHFDLVGLHCVLRQVVVQLGSSLVLADLGRGFGELGQLLEPDLVPQVLSLLSPVAHVPSTEDAHAAEFVGAKVHRHMDERQTLMRPG